MIELPADVVRYIVEEGGGRGSDVRAVIAGCGTSNRTVVRSCSLLFRLMLLSREWASFVLREVIQALRYHIQATRLYTETTMQDSLNRYLTCTSNVEGLRAPTAENRQVDYVSSVMKIGGGVPTCAVRGGLGTMVQGDYIVRAASDRDALHHMDVQWGFRLYERNLRRSSVSAATLPAKRYTVFVNARRGKYVDPSALPGAVPLPSQFDFTELEEYPEQDREQGIREHPRYAVTVKRVTTLLGGVGGILPHAVTLTTCRTDNDCMGDWIVEPKGQLCIAIHVIGLQNVIDVCVSISRAGWISGRPIVEHSQPLIRCGPLARYTWKLVRLCGSLARHPLSNGVSDLSFAGLPGVHNRVKGSYKAALIRHVNKRCIGCGGVTKQVAAPFGVLLCYRCIKDSRRPGLRFLTKTEAKTHLPSRLSYRVSELPCIRRFGYQQLVAYADVLRLRREAGVPFEDDPPVGLFTSIVGPTIENVSRFATRTDTRCLLYPRDSSWSDALYP